MDKIEKMMCLFSGFDGAHGVFKAYGKADEKGKKSGKTYIKKQPASKEDFKRHLSGNIPSIGIIPLMEGDVVRFGAIDIDDYDLDIFDFDRKVQELNLNLITCRSKSGGIHIYAFFPNSIKADIAVKFLKIIADKIGYPKAEIFPKQTKRKLGDTGNFINLPYFGGDQTDRYAIRKGEKLSLEQFLEIAGV